MFNLEELNDKTLDWSHERGITINGKATTQTLKLMSELGELADNIIKGKDVKDDIGDMLVVLCNIAKLTGTTLEESWNVAYEDIKDRKGFLNEHGNFIKSTTEGYAELLAEFEGKKNKSSENIVISYTRLNSLDTTEEDKFELRMDDGTTRIQYLSPAFQQRNQFGINGMTILEIERA